MTKGCARRRHRLASLLRVTCFLVALADVAPPSPARAADPAVVGQWEPPLKWPAVAVHLIMLPTGKVLFFRGDGSVPKTYVWDPATDTIEQPVYPGDNIFCSAHSFLPDGRVLVTGGDTGDTGSRNRTLIFDPLTSQWSRGPDMRRGRYYPTTIAIGDGRVLVFSGKDENGKIVDLVEAYVEGAGPGGSDAWVLLPGASRSMNYYPRMQLLRSGLIFHLGESPITEVLDPWTESWTIVATTNYSKRYQGTVVMLPPGHERFLITGGGTKDGTPTATAEIIDMSEAAPAWRYTSPMHYRRGDLNAVVLPDATVMVGGGTDDGTPIYPTEIFDPATETWTLVAPLATKRGYHSTAVLLPDARVLWAGANGNPTREIYWPPYLFRGPRPLIESAPSSVEYGEVFGVQTPDALSVASVVFIRLGSATHAANMEQRYVPLTFMATDASTLEVMAPTEPNVAPPGYYMLFIVDGDGIPSVAPFVLLRSSTTPVPTTTTSSTITTTSTSTTSTTTPGTSAGGTSTTSTTLPTGTWATVDVRVATSSDDAEEDATRRVDLVSSDLELIQDKTLVQTVGIRFVGVDIPPGATILRAYIQFSTDEAQNEATNLLIQGQAADSALGFTTAAGNVSSRARTGAAVPWSSLPAWTTVGEAGPNQRTPDISGVIQEIVQRGGWARGNALAVILTGSGHRTAKACDQGPAGAALLHVDYALGDGTATPTSSTTTSTSTTTTTTAAGGTSTTSTTLPTGASTTVDVRVAASSDDAEEDSGRRMDVESSDLELTQEANNQTVGIRFVGVDIPPGATILRAHIQFSTDEVQNGPTSLLIHGQAADNALGFTSAAGNVSSRVRTSAAVPWSSLPAWTTVGEAGPNQRTPDIAGVIQEIVQRGGWARGNALVVILTGSGRRTAKAFDGDPAGAALLHVEY